MDILMKFEGFTVKLALVYIYRSAVSAGEN